MALSIKNRDFEEIARELAHITGKSITDAGLVGLKRELERQKALKRYKPKQNLIDEIREIQRRYAALPNQSPMSDDEILGYDEFGIPTK
jgi:antitoxin VapB